MAWWKRVLVMALAAALLLGAVWWGSGRILPAMRQLAAPKEQRLAVLMYHGVHSDPQKAGDYVITPQALEQDLLFLQGQGCHTVTMREVIAYVRDGAPLPEKPVMLTFDDGYYNNYLNAYPLLQKYGMKAVLSIIVGETDKYSGLDENKESYSHVTWDMVNEMRESGLVEIQNHTYNLHKTGAPRRGAAQRRDETKLCSAHQRGRRPTKGTGPHRGDDRLPPRYLYLSLRLVQPPQPAAFGAAWLCGLPGGGG